MSIRTTPLVQVLRSCICGSDLHLYHGLVTDTRVGSTFGHEFVGRVIEVGRSVRHRVVSDVVFVPFAAFRQRRPLRCPLA